MKAKETFIRKCDDKWRDYVRRQKDENDDKIFKVIDDEIRDKIEIIKQCEDQIKNGVDVPKTIAQ